jgi:tRNA-2-methylthio-N6-dimethylallyladenosine synthase
MSSKKRAYVETYGCQMNISDGELMAGHLSSTGYEIVSSPEEADVVLVNTCAIREHAETRVLGRVAQLNGLKEKNPELVIGVTGCMAQRMGDTLLEKAPYVDLVMGPDGYRQLPGALETLETPPQALVQISPSRKGGRERMSVLELDPQENYEGLEIRRTSGVSAWVSIQRGCDHRCTFCIVPYVRGPEKNRDPQSVLKEIRDVVEEGISEVTLLGQTVNSYRSGEWDFPTLLREVARVDGIRRVRFTSPPPNDVTPELVEVMATEEAVCEQLHLPLQAGNDRTLKRMLRRHTVDDFRGKVELVRSAIPDIALSTDLIVAFPGETEEEFQDTLSLVREIRFDDAFTYRYSPRDGTPATRFPASEFIPEAEGKARLEALIQVTREIQGQINATEVGGREEVLVEKPGKEPGHMLGRTRKNKVVVFPADTSMAGSYGDVELSRTTGVTFVGTLVNHIPSRENP